MDLSPKSFSKSEVAENYKNVVVGSKLCYIDSDNYIKCVVTELFDGGFVAVNDEDKSVDHYFFDYIQVGWSFV